MSGIAGLLGSKKGSLALIGAALLFLADSGWLETEPEPYIVYCGTGLFGLSIVCQTVLDALDRFKPPTNGS